MSAKNKKKLDYKQLKLSDDYWYRSGEEQEEEQEKQEEKLEEQKKQDKKPLNPQEMIEWMINKEDSHVNNELFKKHFKIETTSLMYKVLHRTYDKEKNSILVSIFNNGLKDLKEEIQKMPKEETEIEKPDEIVRVVEIILDLINNNQMLSRLPTALAQL